MVICLKRGADCLHTVQLTPLLSQNTTISCLIWFYLTGTSLLRLSWRSGCYMGLVVNDHLLLINFIIFWPYFPSDAIELSRFLSGPPSTADHWSLQSAIRRHISLHHSHLRVQVSILKWNWISNHLSQPSLNMNTHTRLTALCPGLQGWAGTRKAKPFWILLKQETVSGSGISWAMCKSAPRSRQITMPTPYHSFLQAGCPSCRPTNSIKALKA